MEDPPVAKHTRFAALVTMSVLLVATLGFEGMTQVASESIFSLTVAPVQPNNPRNSEADIIKLSDGSLLLGWTEFYEAGGADHAPARLVGKVSTDGGKTWGDKYTLVENDGGCNVMEVNFLRLKDGRIALWHCRKDTEATDCRVMVRTSDDEGNTFGPARQLSPDGKYTGLTNGRAIRLGTGSILLPAWEGGDSYCYISDDDGEMWRAGGRIRPENGECWEPACIELTDGRVMMLMRTQLGAQYRSISTDGGDTWSVPVATPLACSASPVCISRIPTSGQLVAIWNHDPGITPRSRLTAAVSADEGETWEAFRNIEEGGADRWAYPALTWVDDVAVLTYFNYSGGLSLQLKRLPADWFGEQ